ncbi:hypothetical protein CgunFtcFv8_006514 [Champsocephalus gunnari]|uniref:Glycosyl hydrolase family 13 catalytic domain-containing protein n=1 Tax=Champsocephalus gunnari TaxID=52237 RepID=A0AAN8GWM7_CHAGU|nr:hypothetical protein CgunFtcFv8_006514 [Champsocephalus gunnari]
MTKDAEIDMKEVELREMDPEKQPMTSDGPPAGREKNGTVKVKVPDNEVTFTGLSKEELMKVAGTPGWVRTRWALLILFWLGWVGMLAGAIVIIVQAPRCKPIPEMNWWNEGPLYQISDSEAFADGLTGVEARLDEINKLKVKGLVLGPLHTIQPDMPATLNLKEIDPTKGNEPALLAVLEKAHKKGISVVLDLTPNYLGNAPWFSPSELDDVMEKVNDAAEYWLGLGVDGIKVSDFTSATNSFDWSKFQAVVKGNLTEETKKRVLMGVVKNVSDVELFELVNTTSVDLVLSDLLSRRNGGVQRIMDMNTLSSQQRSVAWGLGAANEDQLSKRATTPALIRLYQLLLFTMPGTPVFTYGDEIGLQAIGSESPKMVWDIEKEPVEGAAVNDTAEVQRKEYVASERYITAVNWGAAPETLAFKLEATEGLELPETATVTLATDEALVVDSTVTLDKFVLAPGQAVLLQFP